MLQVARLAPKQLGESRDLVAGFLRDQVHDDGGFRNRAGESDLYYTVFGLEALVALREEPPFSRVARYLEDFADGATLDFVHLCCLARAWASVSRDLADVPGQAILSRIEAYRTPDAGYHAVAGAAHGTVYGAFLALGAYQDLRGTMPCAEKLPESIRNLQAADGGYANQPGATYGLTPATAAAAILMRHFEEPLPALTQWLLNRALPGGGFIATPSAPIPDLLSTATALHALAGLHTPIEGIREPCLDFVDTLWTNRGGFYGHWSDDALDCEYTWYALLALGHLSV